MSVSRRNVARARPKAGDAPRSALGGARRRRRRPGRPRRALLRPRDSV